MSKHSIVHVEIPTQDPEASNQFYSELFGWTHKFFPELDYHRFYTDEGPGGGYVGLDSVFAKEAGHESHQVRISVLTDDIEGTLAKAEKLGAKTVKPRTEIPDMGWYAIFADPEGNYIGLFTP
jgi:predicted enzyme related to lactoylglutathione lyase